MPNYRGLTIEGRGGQDCGSVNPYFTRRNEGGETSDFSN